MRKILGLDIGTNSIGWALVGEAENAKETSKIIDMGVKVISMDQGEIKRFESGETVTPNQHRRVKRQIRRNNWRYKQRREALVSKFVELKWMPSDWLHDMKKRQDGLKIQNIKQLYELRAKAANGEKISLQNLARILYHLNQKRGYKSNRKADLGMEESSNSTLLSKIEKLESILKKKNYTVGQLLYEYLDHNTNARIKGQTFTRQSYEKEFDIIWKNQARHYPDILNDELRDTIRNKIIFYQRPLKSQKKFLAECPFEKRYFKKSDGTLVEKGIKVAPRSSPVFQEFKIWQILSNIRVSNLKLAGQQGFDKNGTRELSKIERRAGYEYLLRKKKVGSNTSFLKQALKLNPQDGYSINNYETLEGDETRIAIAKAFSKNKLPKWIYSFNPECRLDDQPLYELWHCLYSIEDPEALKKRLKSKFDFDNETINKLLKVSFTTGYGSLSTKAMQKLIPHLKKGLTYDKACLKVFEETGNDNWKSQIITKEQRMKKQLNAKITSLPYQSLRNPIVERIVQHVINLVNSIIDDMELVNDKERQEGKFIIRLELARALKQTAKQRQRTSNMIRENEEKRSDAVDKIKELSQFSRGKVTSRDIERYLLWIEGGRQCPYSFKTIQLSEVFSGNCDIDHIIPKSRFFDDSMNNKVLCFSTENKNKGNRTAYEYMEDKDLLDKFKNYVLGLKHMPYHKKMRLLSESVPDGFVNRQIKESQYITIVVRQKLYEISHEVQVTSGSITAFLRHEWGLSKLLHDLNFEKYQKQKLIEEVVDRNTGEISSRIKDWSKRSDHRHHAIDALVVAFTKHQFIQYLNKLNSNHGSTDIRNGWKNPFRIPMQDFYNNAKEYVEAILVKHQKKQRLVTTTKHRHKARGIYTGKIQIVKVPRGQLHKEQVYGKIKTNGKEEIVIRYPLNSSFKAHKVKDIIDPIVRCKVQDRLNHYEGDPKKAFKDLENNPLYFNKEAGIVIRSVRCRTGLKAVIPIHENIIGDPVDYVQTRNNHHVALYKNSAGELSHRVITFWEAVERVNSGMSPYENENGTLVATLAINDMFVYGLSPDKLDFYDNKNRKLLSKHLYRVQKVSGERSIDITFRHHLDPTTSDTTVDKGMKKFLRITSLKNLHGTKVWLDQKGKIVKTGFYI